LVEEDLRHLRIPMLAGVHDHLVDAGVAKREREWRGLDELRPVSDDGDDDHDRATIRGASGPLAQLVEQGTLNPKVEGSIPSRPIPSRLIANGWHVNREASAEA